MRIDRDLASDIIGWDVANWSRALDFWEQRLAFSWSERSALEVGAKDGGISLYLALQGCNVVCSDLGGPSEKARFLHQKHKLGHKIQYREIDATAMDFPDESFDLVVFKSVLGGIGWDGAVERQRLAIDEMFRVLKTGGALLFAENLRGSPAHMWARRTFKTWGGSWRYLTIEEIVEYTGAFTHLDWKTFGFLGALGRSEREKQALSKIDTVVSPWLASSMRYIFFGCAIK